MRLAHGNPIIPFSAQRVAMYTCGACLRRASHVQPGSIVSRNLNVNRYKLLPFRTITRVSRPNREYATVAAQTSSSSSSSSSWERTRTRTRSRSTSPREGRYSEGRHLEGRLSEKRHSEKRHSGNRNSGTRHTGKRHSDGRYPDKQQSNESPDNRRRSTAASRATEWAAQAELHYLQDPYHIAKRVKSALFEDNWDLAYSLARNASTDYKVTVSWNHLIEYQLRSGKLHSALKIYNEMKKRSQVPNAQTYTIIFKGCATSHHPKLAVNEAVKLYQNMMAVGRIRPNIIHLNAVLQVCAKAGDIETMFSLLASSKSPLRNPNNLTYTTILNALRNSAEQAQGNPFKRIQDKEIEREKNTAITHAQSIWNEVVQKWRSGALMIDEELVCAMGRIMLLGGYKEADAVESLIEQTMMISRAENKGLSGRNETEGAVPPVTRPATQASRLPTMNYALPGNNSLSLLLEAVEKTGRTTQAIKYWNVFTLHYNVVPDADNWARAFRVFQRGKNSGRAATTLLKMPAAMRTPKHVRLALKACLRDNYNKKAFDHATEVVEIMAKQPHTIDVRALRLYLQIAHATKLAYSSTGTTETTETTEITETTETIPAELKEWIQNLASALDRLFPHFVTLTGYSLDPTRPNREPETPEQTQNWKAEIAALGRKMCSAHDILTTQYKTALPVAQLERMAPQHAFLSRHVTRFFEEVKQGSEQIGKAEENLEEASEEDPDRSKPAHWQGDAEDDID